MANASESKSTDDPISSLFAESSMGFVGFSFTSLDSTVNPLFSMVLGGDTSSLNSTVSANLNRLAGLVDAWNFDFCGVRKAGLL